MVTSVVGATRSNMNNGYPDYSLEEMEEEWYHLFSDPRAIIMGGKRIKFARPPPTFVPEEDLWEDLWD